MSTLIFDLSAKVAINILKHSFLRQFLANWNQISYDWLAKTYTNCYGHMTNMATMPIYGKNSLNLFFSGTKRPLALGPGM